jgi:hypothetical protein
LTRIKKQTRLTKRYQKFEVIVVDTTPESKRTVVSDWSLSPKTGIFLTILSIYSFLRSSIPSPLYQIKIQHSRPLEILVQPVQEVDNFNFILSISFLFFSTAFSMRFIHSIVKTLS